MLRSPPPSQRAEGPHLLFMSSRAQSRDLSKVRAANRVRSARSQRGAPSNARFQPYAWGGSGLSGPEARTFCALLILCLTASALALSPPYAAASPPLRPPPPHAGGPSAAHTLARDDIFKGSWRRPLFYALGSRVLRSLDYARDDIIKRDDGKEREEKKGDGIWIGELISLFF